MPKKEPFAKGRRVCPFCGGSSQSVSSGEHVWPDWAGPFLPTRATKREHFYKGQDGFVAITEVRKNYQRQGSPSGIKIKGPCKKCNETWMSKLETSAKPILILLLQGLNRNLTRKETEIVSQWAFLKFCVVSCQDKEIWCVSDSERKQFKENLEIPKRFSAWVFRHNVDDWFDRNLWFSSRVRDPNTDFRPNFSDPHNVNTFALGFGRALFLCVFQWGVRIDTGFSRKHAAKLWPMRLNRGLQLPSVELDEDEVNAVARLLPLAAEDG